MHEVDQDVVAMYTLVTIFSIQNFLTFFLFIMFMRVLRVHVGYLLLRVYVGYLLWGRILIDAFSRIVVQKKVV